MPTRQNKEFGRLAIRASTRYFVRSAALISRAINDHDILRGLIFMAIVHANTRHLDPAGEISQTYSESGDRVPDEIRDPISIHALAIELGMPYETTRRHVKGLIDKGLCKRTKAGVFVPADALASPAMVTAHKRNIDNLKTLFADLKAGGFDPEA